MKIKEERRFAFVELDSLDFSDDADLEPIFGLSAINESGEIIEIDGGELRKEDYERVKVFVGDRTLYFNERRFYESFFFASAIRGVPIPNYCICFWASSKNVGFVNHPNWQGDGRKLLKAMRELILSGSYLDDWECLVQDVFSKDISQEVIEHYLGILKAKCPERSSRNV